MLGQGDWIGITVLRRRSFRFRLHASLATWREGEGRSPWHKMQACHHQPQEIWDTSSRPPGALGWAIGRVSPGVRTAI